MDGAELRRIRDRLHLTQVALGKILGIAGNTVSRRERNLLPIKRAEAQLLIRLWRERIDQEQQHQGR